MADDSRTDKFTWTKGQIQEIEIFFVWYDSNYKTWAWAKKLTPEDNDDAGEMSSQFNIIDKEFLGIPVDKLENGAYDQHGNRIPDDDPILSA